MEKKKENQNSQKDLGDSLNKIEGVYANKSNLDDMILEPLERYKVGLLEQQHELMTELQLIEEERTNLRDEICSAITNLKEARVKLEDQVKNKYGSHFLDAMGACDNCIQSYEALLDMLQVDSSRFEGDIDGVIDAFQKEQSIATELRIKEQAINMLISMTPAQRSALRYYTAEGSRYMNNVLRTRNKSINENVNNSIRELHNMLKEHRTSVPVTLYRGIESDVTMVNGSNKGLDQYSDAELCGKLLTDRAFVSTSLRKEDAFSKPTMLVLNAPVGTYGAYVGDVGSYGDAESEFLMDCCQAFRVTKIDRINGKRYIYADVIVRSSL